MPRTGLTPQELRTRAIEVALERIRAQGFDNVKLTDVARELGISHVALYARFESKEALLDAVLEMWLADTTAALDAVCASKRKPMAKLEQWFLTQYTLKRDRALHDRAVYQAFAMATATNKPFACAYLERRRQQLLGILEEARDLLGSDPLERQAAVLLDGMAGFLHPRLILEGAETNREAPLKRVLQTLLRGLAAPR